MQCVMRGSLPMLRRATILLMGLLVGLAACVINTRPHLPGDAVGDDAGRNVLAFDAGVGDAVPDLTGTTTATDAGPTDGAPPLRDGAGGGETDASCIPVGRRADGGPSEVTDGGDAGFIDREGRPCDPTRPQDAGGDAGNDGGDAG